jgi:hypothetical protein
VYVPAGARSKEYEQDAPVDESGRLRFAPPAVATTDALQMYMPVAASVTVTEMEGGPLPGQIGAGVLHPQTHKLMSAPPMSKNVNPFDHGIVSPVSPEYG